MTGSALAPVVIPIVVVFSLAAWLTMVLRAGSHPEYRRHISAKPHPSPAGVPDNAVPVKPRPRTQQNVPAAQASEGEAHAGAGASRAA